MFVYICIHTASGQEANHLRNRRGPARRRHCNRVRAHGHELHCVYGRRGLQAPVTQRLPHPHAWRHCRARRNWIRYVCLFNFPFLLPSPSFPLQSSFSPPLSFLPSLFLALLFPLALLFLPLFVPLSPAPSLPFLPFALSLYCARSLTHTLTHSHTHSHAQGRHQRSDARLGHQRA